MDTLNIENTSIFRTLKRGKVIIGLASVILITIVIGILISALLYYFFVYSCEKDNTHEFDYLNFECLEKNSTKQSISTVSN